MKTEIESKKVVKRYGIATTDPLLARDAGVAAELAARLRPPIDMKVVSTDIVHKAAAGGVRLNLRTEEGDALVLALLLSSGCGARWDIVAPESEMEQFIVAETSRFAKLQGVNVRGEISDTPYFVGTDVATGWYQAGVAYYYRPYVRKMELSLCTDVACHEVCHAKNPNHDHAHWECMAKWASPTYPEPSR